jgi:PEP-CTERM motif
MKTMRLVKLTTLIALCLVLSLPAFAGFTTFSQPGDDGYIANTTNYGGGDGSGNFITSLGPFDFSNPQSENNVPNSWATWGCPPQTESCTPNVLWNEGFSSLTLTLTSAANIVGFELEPDNFAVEETTAQFFNGGTLLGTIDLFPNGSAGALLFAAQSDQDITSVVITNLAGDDFAIAQLRAGETAPATTPEPGTMVLLGTGLLGALGVMRRKMNL